MRRLLVFACLLGGLMLWPLLFAQKTVTGPEEIRVDSLLAQKQYEQAIPLLEQLREAAGQAKQWDDYQRFTVKFVQAIPKGKDLDRVRELLVQSIEKLKAAGQGESNLSAELWMWLAIRQRSQEKYADALESYRNAIRIYEKNHFNGKDLAYCYKNAAQILMRLINYKQADDYLKAALNSDSTGKNQLSIFGQLAASAYWQDSLPLALEYFQMGQNLSATNERSWIDLQLTGAQTYAKTGRLDEAQRLAQNALAYYDTIPKDGEHRVRCLSTLADIAARAGQSRQAEIFFRRAETEGFAYFDGKKSREMAKLYTEWADFHAAQDRPEVALAYYQKAIVQAFPAFDDLNPAANPSPDAVPLESWAMRATARKALLLLNQPRPDIAARQNAAACFQLAFAAAAELRRVYGADEAKLFLAQYNRDIRRAAALNLWALYGELPERSPDLLAQLFVLLEDTRAAALRDALQQQRALALSGVPDSLLRREELLRFQIADASNALQSAEGDRDTARMEKARTDLFQSERRHAELLDLLQTANPQLARFTRQTPPPDPATLRAALPDSAALLAWFDAGDRYLCAVARRDGLSAYEVPRDSAFDGLLKGFLARLADKPAQENAPNDYFAEAFALGERLLPPQLLGEVRTLIVVPDGRLCYLPFEALLTAPHRGNFGAAPYLLRSHTVRYAWSAALLTAPAVRRTPAGAGFLHVAPFVETARDGLAPLPGSRRERPAGGAVAELFGPAATAAAFLEKCPRYEVLQLSTHAHAGGTAQPGIELFDRTLTLPEIYAQRLPATLVALSACETGAGEYAEGEGVLSLARAFAYAGAGSLLASHWAVNERSTAELFSGFYKKLAAGSGRAEALRQAKLDWLNGPEADARKAPWHWAAFTLSGADGPVDLPGGAQGAWIWWVLAAAVLATWVVWGYGRAGRKPR